MPQTPHIERHFTAGEVVRVALAAGISGAVDNSRLVVIAGLAEIAAGSIAMGLGGYLAARSDAEHYASERVREEREVEEIPDEEAREVVKVFTDYGLTREESAPVVEAMTKKPTQWVDFMMRFELGLEEPNPKRALQSALTIAGSYIAGGFIPLSPYMILHSSRVALVWSAVVTLIALGVFGYIKGRFTGSRPGRSALQTIVIGGLAAGAAFLIAKAIS
jgi:VIT1/CCC1 family predicted Fe2+/Mn2+ transporter